jgi:hypothetical protein
MANRSHPRALVSLVSLLLLVGVGPAAAAEGSLRSAESRKAVVATGISGPYFDRHFKLVRIIDEPGDRRILWKYTVNGYETTVTDTVGYHTEGGRRVDVHSIADTVGRTRDITRTIPRERARRALRECLGRYTGESVVFTTLGASRQAGLYLTAHTVSKIRESAEERARELEREKARSKVPAPTQTAPGGPPPPRARPVEGEDEKGPPVYIGYVDLETGKCSKVQARAAP